jgi:mitosis inhibitor protein kinase SWE1
LLEVHRALKLTKIGQEQKISSEIGSVKYCDYCVKVYEAWEESGYLYIRSELCEKGNLNDYLVELEKIQENELLKDEDIWKFLYQMACAIKHVHDSGFVHLDIKPSNFFVMSDGSIKLGDFGQAIELCNLVKIRDDDVEGDSVYMAPELLKNNIRAFERITKKADIFSLGASLLELASGMNLP